jgi:nucleoside-diphosphate-sugar epimerase
MQIIITGGAGFLGQQLAIALTNSPIAFDRLKLVDVVMPSNPVRDERVSFVQMDISSPGTFKDLITPDTGLVFHLAAIVSGHAEKDFDLGYRVNVAATHDLLETCRQKSPGCRIVFTSSCAVFGGPLPAVVEPLTALMPQTSYGTQKAIGEFLINDYTRKGFIDGRSLRLPTICVRPGRPNQAASSFVSGVIREPINGETANCPVSIDLSVWISSPAVVIQNIIHAARVEPSIFNGWRSVNLPGISVTVKEMLNALERQTDAVTKARVTFNIDPVINKIVLGWPTNLDNTQALSMGFKADANFDDVVAQYLTYIRSST